MNPKLKELQDQHAAKTAEAEGLLAKTDATSDDIAAAKTIINKDLPALKAEIQEFLGVDDLVTNLGAHKTWSTEATRLPQPGQGTGAGQGAGTQQAARVAGKTEIDLFTGEIAEIGEGVLTHPQMKATADPEYLKAFGTLLRAGGVIEKVKSVDARKALVEGIDSDGGQLVPAQILAGILMKSPAPTRILDNIQVITVSSDKAMMLRSIYNTDDLYSSAVRVYKTGEGALATVTDKPQFGTLTIDIHNFTAELAIQRQLLEDTAFDLLGFIAQEFRNACNGFAADKVLNGSGVNEHFGILTRVGQDGKGPAVINSGSASAITWTGLRQVKNAVPEQYDGNSKYYFNKKSTQDAIEALVDGNNRPLWPESQRSGLESGTPGTLQGYAYVREARMPDVGASTYPVLFGDMMGYGRAIRLGMTLEPYRELEARRGQVVFLLRMREGGEILEPWRMKALRCHT